MRWAIVHNNGMGKTIHRDPDGMEIGFGPLAPPEG
jgi:hypothetical protein